MITHPAGGRPNRRLNDALHLATVQDADALVPFKRLQDVVHVISQVNNARFHTLPFLFLYAKTIHDGAERVKRLVIASHAVSRIVFRHVSVTIVSRHGCAG